MVGNNLSWLKFCFRDERVQGDRILIVVIWPNKEKLEECKRIDTHMFTIIGQIPHIEI